MYDCQSVTGNVPHWAFSYWELNLRVVEKFLVPNAF